MRRAGMTDLQVQRPTTVRVVAIMAFIGAGWLVLRGVGFLVVANSAGFAPIAGDVTLASAPSPVPVVVGIVFLLVSASLVILGRRALRGANAARLGLSTLGVAFIAAQLALIVSGTGGAVFPMVWIGVALSLLWHHSASAWFRST